MNMLKRKIQKKIHINACIKKKIRDQDNKISLAYSFSLFKEKPIDI